MRNIKKLMVGLAALFLLAGCGSPAKESSNNSNQSGTVTPSGTSVPVDPSSNHEHDFHYEHNDDEHWQVCACGETTEKVAHEFTESITKQPTCTEEGVKTFSCVCGYSFTRSIEAKGHSWDEGKVTTEPTAVTPGVKTYTCKECGQTRTEAIAASVAMVEDSEVILEGYSKIYRFDVNAETLGFTTAIEVSDMDLDVNVAVKVVDGGQTVFYQPIIGGTEFQWITSEENNGGWANVYETWYKGAAKLDAQGKLSVQIKDYEARKFPVGAKIYVAVELICWKASKVTDKVFNEEYTTYAIEVLKECGSFVGAVKYDKANTAMNGAVTVDGGTTWVGVKGNSLDLWFRPEKNTGDWWEGYNTWKEFSATTDENSLIKFEINEYDAKFTVGTKIYIALKEAPVITYSFAEATTPVEGYAKAYELTFTSPSNSIETDQVVGKAGEIIKGAFTITCPDENVYFQPQIGDSTDKFFHGGDSWWVKLGNYTPFTATLDDQGQLNIKVNDYLGAQFPTGSKLIIAFNGDNNLGYIVGKSSQVVEGYSNVYAIDIVREVNTFNFKLACGEANAEMIGKVTVFGKEDNIYYEPQIGSLTGTFWHSGESWWTSYGVYKGFTATLDAEGKLDVTIKDFDNTKFAVGASIHIAIKPVPADDYSLYKTTSYEIAGYKDVYCIEINKPCNTITTSIAYGEGAADVTGKVTVVGLEDDVYYEPQIGSLTGTFWHSGDGWWSAFGALKDFTANLDEEGKLAVTIKDFDSVKFPAEAKIYIALKLVDHSAPKCTVEASTEALPEGVTGQVYKVTLTAENLSSFSANIPCATSGACKLYVKVGADLGEAWLIANTKDSDGTIMCNKNYGWSNHIGEWMNADATATSDGTNAPVYFWSANAGGGMENPIAYTNGLVIYVALVF